VTGASTTSPIVRVGVLAVQGDVREHLRALTLAGADAVPVRRPEELAQVDGLVIPGGGAARGRHAGLRVLRRHDPAGHGGA
jgi:5'-phosphate synthase pdxT subunit